MESPALGYFCVSWLQLALVGVAMSGRSKASVALGGALLISWGLSAALRRVPGVRMLLGEGGAAATGA